MRSFNSATWLGAILLGVCMLPAAAADSADEHAHHRHELAAAAATAAGPAVSMRHYAVPNRRLQDESGRDVDLADVLSADQPIILNFIYTTCTTICPVMTATQLQLQRRLADAGSKPRFVSISIDPDFDTARVLKRYAANHGADWTFLTGRRNNILEVLTGFEAWRGNKGNHAALTLMRPAHAHGWTRVDGLASAQQLADIWHSLDH